jgi:hypothetical protein
MPTKLFSYNFWLLLGMDGKRQFVSKKAGMISPAFLMNMID